MKCKCGSSKHKITGGGEYFKKLKNPVWRCIAKSCTFPKMVVNLQWK